MSWEAIGAIGEVLGAIGVFASLIYLAIQIRQNTRMMKATIRLQLTAASQQNIHEIGRSSVMPKLATGQDLTPEEQVRAASLVRSTLRGWENYAYQRAQGLFDDSEWSALVESMRRFMAVPFYREQWADTRHEYSGTLQRIIDPMASSPERSS